MFMPTMAHLHDQILHCPPNPPLLDQTGMIRRPIWKLNPEIAPNCPRCASSNTKFCYYNNYSLSQPRYFCKGCRRYWTKGGSLRNVPVGGGCRRNRRGKSVKHASSTSPDGNGDSLKSGNCSNSSSDSALSEQSGTHGSDIDLAAVFARFLSNNDHTSSVSEPEIMMTNTENQSSADIDPLDLMGSEFLFEGIEDVLVGDNEDDQKLEQQPVLLHNDQGFEEIGDSNGFEYEVVPDQDFEWAEAISFPNFGNQPAAVDMDYSCSFDQSLVGDNWSSFDLPDSFGFPQYYDNRY